LVLKRYQATIEEATRPSGLNPLEGLLVTFLCNNPDKDTFLLFSFEFSDVAEFIFLW
jgi:hypothetical protein